MQSRTTTVIVKPQIQFSRELLDWSRQEEMRDAINALYTCITLISIDTAQPAACTSYQQDQLDGSMQENYEVIGRLSVDR